LIAVVSAKLQLQGVDDPTRINGEYIIVYHENTTLDTFNGHLKGLSSGFSFTPMYTYVIGETFKGFAAKLTNAMVDSLLDDPLVSAIHCNGMATIADNSCDTTQPNAPSWGIARTSHKGGLDQGGLRDEYFHDANGGAGCDAYILDTGIYTQHNDFEGRATVGANFVDNNPSDQNSHGTHCAGTVGGRLYGVAKGVTLIAVKVLNAQGSGSYAGIIQGVNWVTTQYTNRGRPGIASMSLGGPQDGGMCAALQSSRNAGVIYSVAAGNSNTNACNSYPAGCAAAFTVGSTNIANFNGADYDERSSFSNYGTCVKIWAPGSSITSTCNTGPNTSCIKSGTSMACPHVTGGLALVYGQDPSQTPTQVEARLKTESQKGLIDNIMIGSPNELLYNYCDEN